MRNCIIRGFFILISLGFIFPMYGKISGNCGEKVNWELENSVLTVSGTGEMYDYFCINSLYASYPGWYDFRDDIKSVVIEPGVTYIGNYAFEGYNNLENVQLPAGLTEIGSFTFANCPALRKIELPNDLEKIGDHFTATGTTRGCSFQNCISIESVTLPEPLTSLGGDVFNGCYNLKTVYWNAVECHENSRETVTSNNANFQGSGVETVKFGPKVKIVPRQEFYNAGNLKEIITSGSIEYVGDKAFYGTKWQSNLPQYELCYIDHVAYIFKGFNDLTDNFEIEFKEGTVTITDFLFEGARRLSKIIVPESVRYVGNDAFRDCTSLSEVVWNAEEIVKGEFLGIRKYNAKSLFSSALLSISFGETVKMLPDYFLDNCSGISELNLPSSLREIGDYAINKCSSLSSLFIPDSVITMGKYAISYCTDLEVLVIGEGLKNFDLSYMFCDNLKTLEWNAIRCDGETSYIGAPIETFITGDKVELIPKYIFSRSETLANVVLGNNVKEIGEESFGYCTNLTQILLPLSLEIISNYAFRDSNLQYVVIPPNVKSIGTWAFFNVPLEYAVITPVDLPEGGMDNYNGCTLYVSYPELYKNNQPWAAAQDNMEPMAIADNNVFNSNDTNINVNFECNIPGYSMHVKTPELDLTPGAHTIFVEAAFSGAEDFNSLFAYEYNVIDQGIPPIDIVLNLVSAEVKIGEIVKLIATVYPESTTDKTVVWKSSNEGVATVSENGLVTAISAGESIITASCGEVSAECIVTVLEDAGVESLLANPDSRISVYTTDGVLIKRDCNVEDLKSLSKGIYIIVCGKDRYKITI